MKVLMLNPPMLGNVFAYRGERCWRQYPFLPFPFRLAQIAGGCRDLSVDLKVIDCQAEKLSYADVGKLAKNWGADLVFFISGNGFIKFDSKIATAVKKYSKAKVAICEPLIATSMPEFVFERFTNIDIILRGEGSYSFRNLLEGLLENKTLDKINNIAYKEDGKVYLNKIIESNYFTEVSPAFDLFDIRKYSVFSMGLNGAYKLLKPGIFYRSTRGCPYSCTFCLTNSGGGRDFKRLMMRPIEKISEDLLNLKKEYNLKGVFFWDETLTIDRERILKVSESLRGQNINWGGQTRVDKLDYELLKKMYSGGCRYLELGVETLSEKSLKSFNKMQTVKQINTVFKWCKSLDIATLALFVLGAPGENRQDILNTISYLKDLPASNYRVTYSFPFPFSPLYKEVIEKKWGREEDIRNALVNRQISGPLVFETGDLSKAELIELRKVFEKEMRKLVMHRSTSYVSDNIKFILRCLPHSYHFLFNKKLK